MRNSVLSIMCVGCLGWMACAASNGRAVHDAARGGNGDANVNENSDGGGGGGDGGSGEDLAATGRTGEPGDPDLAGWGCSGDPPRSCYPASADPATRHVGACKDGTQTCTVQGEFS